MKTPVLYIETRKKFNLEEIDFSPLDKLPGKTISLAATVQYLDIVPEVKKYLESKGKEVILKKGAFYDAHVLGCNSAAFDKNTDALLLITDGKFHAINNAIQLQKEIFVFTTRALEKISQEDLDAHKKKIRGKQTLFLSAKTVGLIISSKPGQNVKSVQVIKDKIKKLDKNVYVFEANNINIAEFENFPEIKIWVNTACYGLARDNIKIVNLQDILEFL
jgi:diphthamide biosynthesis enzyme Dph1/Dph2-like protein